MDVVFNKKIKVYAKLPINVTIQKLRGWGKSATKALVTGVREIISLIKYTKIVEVNRQNENIKLVTQIS